MLAKVVGVESQKFTLDNGYHFEGWKLYCIDLEEEKENLAGHTTVEVKVPVDHRDYNQPFEVGKEYVVYFTKKGKLDLIRPNK